MPPKKDTEALTKQPQKTQKKKEGSGSGKAKKKWSKGNVRDKLNNQVWFDKPTYEGSALVQTDHTTVVFERLTVRGSPARRAVIELRETGLIKQVVQHHGQVNYTRATKGDGPVA